MDHARRIVVFTTRLSDPGTIEVVESLTQEFPDYEFLVVAGDLKISRRRWLRNKWKRLLREPLSYPLELAGQVLGKFRRRSDRSRASRVSLPQMDQLERVQTAHFEWIHDPDCLTRVEAFQPWLGLSIGAPILRRKLFGLPDRGTLNLHQSLLPEYRGMPVGFWEIHDGATESGASVHWMDDGLDTGEVVTQRALSIPMFATPLGLRHKLHQVGIDALVEAVKAVDSNTESAIPQAEPRTPTRSRPPMLLARRVQQRSERKREPARSLPTIAKSAIKQSVFFAYVHAFAPIRNLVRARSGRCHATVLLWHRIDDSYHDSISTGVEQFDRQVAMLRRHYEVLDLETFLNERGKPRRRPVVVLTFDDGFEDNFDAARLLRRHGLPCTFFFSTRIVGTGGSFPYDSKHEIDPPSKPLSWDQVRTMHRHGFRIGNHTQFHTNSAEGSTEDALEAVRLAAEDLRRELPPNDDSAEPDKWFAYCFGGRRDMTEEVRSGLADLGMKTCLSAYGGVNPPDWDPMDIQRQGVAANFSDLAFRALVEGWTLPDPKGY
ncbi:MAG: formyltransferase family protein [Planctomycetota bacterium]